MYSTAKKYAHAFILLIVLPVFIVGAFTYHFYIDSMLNNITHQVSNSLQQISVNMGNEILRLSYISSNACSDMKTLELATKINRSEDDKSRYDQISELNSQLNLILGGTYDCESVIFFFKNKGMYYYNSAPTIDEAALRKMKWYKEALNNSDTLSYDIFQNFTDPFSKKYVVSFFYSPQTSTSNNDVEVIYISYKLDFLNNLYSNIKYFDSSELFILNPQGKIVFTKDAKFIGKNIWELGYSKKMLQTHEKAIIETVNNVKTFITSFKLNKDGWMAVNIIEYKKLTQDVDRIMGYTSIIGIFIFVMFLIFSAAFFREIIVPIRGMIKSMKQVEQGNFETSIQIKGKSEFYYLGKAFNTMVREIKNLIAERDLKEKERQKAEIEALQFQINPHFMYNTLNSIRLMAIVAKADNVKSMLDAFTQLLSATYDYTNEMIEVKSEIKNLENYIYIMKFRYGNRFKAEFEIDENILSLLIPRMALQPIVENAILHGMSDIDINGVILVEALINKGTLIIKISDNGIGMSEEQVNRLLIQGDSNKRGYSAIGMKNVDKRLKLKFGEQYGLKIESIEGEYTTISVILPIIHKQEDNELNV